MSDDPEQLDPSKLDASNPVFREQTEAAIIAVCTFVAHQIKAGKSQADIRAELLKEGMPESAINKILALVSTKPEAFLRPPRRATRARMRGALISLVWLTLGLFLLFLSLQPIARPVDTLLQVVGWIALLIGGLSLAWIGLLMYLTRPRR